MNGNMYKSCWYEICAWMIYKWSDIDKPRGKPCVSLFPTLSLAGGRRWLTLRESFPQEVMRLTEVFSVTNQCVLLQHQNQAAQTSTPRQGAWKKPQKKRRLQSPKSTWSWQWPPGGNFLNFGFFCVWTHPGQNSEKANWFTNKKQTHTQCVK